MNFSVMTFNLRVNVSGDKENAWPHRYHQAAEVIRKYGPVVVGTQEGLHSMLLELEEQLPDYSWIGQGRRGGHEDEHNAIFYQHKELELMQHGQFWLSEQPQQPGSISWESSFPRICVWAKFRSVRNSNVQFKVFNTHLDHMSERAREEGMRVVLRAMQNHFVNDALPMVLMGDFNSNPQDAAVQLVRNSKTPLFNDSFELLNQNPGLTFHSFKGGELGEPIDYIFVSEGVKLLETAVIRDKQNGRYPSDHYPIITSITLQ